MRISGFTMGRNASKLYYPMKESVASLLPLVDEMFVALGEGDEDDDTEKQILSLQSDKVRIIRTTWDLQKFPNGMENAHQTDIAKSHCSGDWLFYLQADEVLHEKYLPVVQKRCEELLDKREVEGLLFRYRHFWGDYRHYIQSHGWYPEEIRIIRNDTDIHSWESAQSFRRIPDFDGLHYRRQKNTFKLNVARVDAEIYHYGWVRPPELMQQKRKSLDTIHHGKQAAEQEYEKLDASFDYGPMKRLPVFEGTHPMVMAERIRSFHWEDQLNYENNRYPERKRYKHERFRYRCLSWVENSLLGGRQIGGFHNYILLKR